MSLIASSINRAKDLGKQTIYACAFYTGVFALCRMYSKKGLRILCYHGTWEGENKHFSDTLFMSPEGFDKRMALLSSLNYPLLSLDDAVTRLYAGTLPDYATVITIDDGWFSTYQTMLPSLEKHRIPATLYMTTYYSGKQTPIIQVVLRLIIKSSQSLQLDFDALPIERGGKVNLGDSDTREKIATDINALLSTRKDQDRQDFCRLLGKQLNVDYDAIFSSRKLALMTSNEILDADERGLDIQLHTHRHRIDFQGKSSITQEINENQAILQEITGKRAEHFCYPSGIYTPGHWPELQALNIKSATTCLNGLNYHDTPRYELRRTLDAESISTLEFKAELSGFGDLQRSVLSRLKAWFTPNTTTTPTGSCPD